MNKTYKFALVLIGGQLQGLALLFNKHNKAVASWLSWAGKALRDVTMNLTPLQMPATNDEHNSPIPENYRHTFQILAVQVQSVAFAVRNIDQNFDGTDDKTATILEKIATVLDQLAN